MKQLIVGVFLIGLFSSAGAMPIGPVYPAPGGNDWSGSGDGLIGTATWSYSNFDTNAFDALFFGLNQIHYGPNGAGLNGGPDPFIFGRVTDQTAEWMANTSWYESTGSSGHIGAATRLTIEIVGLGATPWITNLASVGLNNVGIYGDLGAVVDNSAGDPFTLYWRIEANHFLELGDHVLQLFAGGLFGLLGFLFFSHVILLKEPGMPAPNFHCTGLPRPGVETLPLPMRAPQ